MKKLLPVIFLSFAFSVYTSAQAPVAIPFSSIDGVSVGNACDAKGKTGVTVFWFSTPSPAAVSILGGGPASRETPLLEPGRNNLPINALVLGGGSIFGLEASSGVVKYMEENGIGFNSGYRIIPLAVQSDIFDLGYGKADVAPDGRMGYKACKEAMASNNPVSGNAGAGTGATVGKAKGMKYAQKSGIGYAAAGLGDLKVGVVAVVNAYGDIYYHGAKIAGMLDADRKNFADAAAALYEFQPSNLFNGDSAKPTGNTTLVAVFTNGDFDNAALKKITAMAAAGMARAIRPVFTMADGDTVYAVSVGDDKVSSDINVVGTLAADLVEEAIRDAVVSSSIPEKEYLSNIAY